MLGLKSLQRATESEVKSGNVTPLDYTVVVTQEPHVESLEDLPAVYYAWAENINSSEDIEYKIPNSEDIDQN